MNTAILGQPMQLSAIHTGVKHLDLVCKSLYLSRNRIYMASLTIGVLEKWSSGVLGLADEKQKTKNADYK